MEKHNLLQPVYIDDTNGDSLDSRAANVPFVFVTYGFGHTEDFDIKFDDFNALTDYYMSL